MKTHEIKFFCDRCGKEFKPENGETSFTIKNPYTSPFRIELVGGDDNYLDLCGKCKKDFVDWIMKDGES